MKNLIDEITISIRAGTPVNEWLQRAEDKIIKTAYLRHAYNQVRTAEELGIARGTLRTKLADMYGTSLKEDHIAQDLFDREFG